jgi:hypothetical protein
MTSRADAETGQLYKTFYCTNSCLGEYVSMFASDKHKHCSLGTLAEVRKALIS